MSRAFRSWWSTRSPTPQTQAFPRNEGRSRTTPAPSEERDQEKYGGDGAPVAIKHVAYSRVDRIAQVLHQCGVAQRQPACERRLLHGLDRAGDKTGRADALKIHVAAEIEIGR